MQLSNLIMLLKIPWHYSFITFAKFSEKLTFLTPWYARVRKYCETLWKKLGASFFFRQNAIGESVNEWAKVHATFKPYNVAENTLALFIYYVRKIFRKTNISYPVIRRCAYQEVRHVSFSENFTNVINTWTK